MFVVSLGIFSFCSKLPQLRYSRILDTLYPNLYESTFAVILQPASGIPILFFGLVFIFSGSLFLPSITIVTSRILMLILGAFSILSSFGFFFYPKYQFHFFSIYPFFIFASGLLYIFSSIFLSRLNNRVRKLIIIHSFISMIYFISLLIYCIFPFFSGLALFIALGVTPPYILFPLFLIFLFTRSKVKEQFKR